VRAEIEFVAIVEFFYGNAEQYDFPDEGDGYGWDCRLCGSKSRTLQPLPRQAARLARAHIKTCWAKDGEAYTEWLEGLVGHS